MTIPARLLLVAILALLAGCQTDLPLRDLKERWGGPPSRFLPMDGIEVHWRDEGPGGHGRTDPHAPPAPRPPGVGVTTAEPPPPPAPPGPSAPFPAPAAAGVADAEVPAILLLHGNASSLHTWDGWARRLSPQMRVVRLDLPGFGLTGPHPSGDYTASATVDFLERFADAAGLRRFVIAGNSLGGYYAWRFALRHPERVTALVLVNSVGYPMETGLSGSVALQLARTPVISELMRFVSVRWAIERSLREVYADDARVTRDLVDRYEELMLRPGNRAALGDRARGERRPVGWPRLPQIRVPTLVMWGEQDPWIPLEHAHRFGRDIPAARLVTYPGLGHVPMEEDPEATARDLLRFLREAPGEATR